MYTYHPFQARIGFYYVDSYNRSIKTLTSAGDIRFDESYNRKLLTKSTASSLDIGSNSFQGIATDSGKVILL